MDFFKKFSKPYLHKNNVIVWLFKPYNHIIVMRSIFIIRDLFNAEQLSVKVNYASLSYEYTI